MHYYYDVLGNFDENYLEFYEWEKNDPFTLIKKVPLVRINNKDMLDLLTYKIQIKSSWLEKYKEKTTLKNSKEKPLIILFSSTKTSILLEFDENGKSMYCSKLLVEDENNCNEYAYSMKEISVPYEKLEKLETRKEFRKALEDKKVLKTELKMLEEENNLEKFKRKYKIKRIFIVAVSILMSCLGLINISYAKNINSAHIYLVGDCGSLLTYKGKPVKVSYVEYTEGGVSYPAYCLDKTKPGAES